MVNGYGCKAKQEVRGKLKTFVESVYPSREFRKNLKILTLLGPNDYELRQIWDPLGISRENITSVERDPAVYEEVQNKNLGINLVRGTLEDFVEDTSEKFNILNLDYTGYFSFAKQNTLIDIARKSIIGREGIVATWYSGRREDKESLKFLNDWPVANLEWIKHLHNNFAYDRIKKKFEEIIRKKENSIEANGCRAESIFDIVRFSFEEPYALGFSENLAIPKLGLQEDYKNFLRNHPIVKETKQNFLKLAVNNRSLPEDVSSHTKNSFEAFKRMRNAANRREQISEEDEKIFFNEFNNNLGQMFIREKVEKLVNRELYDFPFQKEELVDNTASLILLSLNKGYISSKNEAYIYFSDKSTPMFVNFNLFERPDIKKYLPFEIRADKTIRICNKKQLRNLSHLRQFARFHEQFFFSHYNPSEVIRINELGEIIDAEPDKKLLTKEEVKDEVVKLIEDGMKSTEIVKVYPQYTDFEVRGIKVWIKRKKNIHGEIKLEEKVSDFIEPISGENLKPIENPNDMTKAEAIFLLREGCTPDQIYEQYSKTFSKKKLGSFRAWYVTMGKKYEDSLDKVVAEIEGV